MNGSAEPSNTGPGQFSPLESQFVSQLPVIAGGGSRPKGNGAKIRTRAEGRCKAGDPHVAIRIKQHTVVGIIPYQGDKDIGTSENHDRYG